MANRFNAIILKCKHQDDDGYNYIGVATVRPADIGLSDVEWHHGARILEHDYPGFTILNKRLERLDYFVVDHNDWIAHIASLDDPETLSVDVYKSSRVFKDKWDPERVIY